MQQADAARTASRAVPTGHWLAFWALCAGALVAGLAAHDQGAPASVPLVVGAWAAMAVAMMAPTAVPMLQVFADLGVRRHGRFRAGAFWAFAGGYVGVWLAASVGFAAAQLEAGGLRPQPTPFALAGLLAVAGVYQLTPLKQACVRRCRSPFAFLLGRWRDGVPGAAALGARHGADCLGCCVALMLLALAGGALQPIVMAGVMLAAAAEKLPRIGEHVSRPLTAALLLGAVALLAGGALA